MKQRDIWKQEKARQRWLGAGARARAKVHRAVQHLAAKRRGSRRTWWESEEDDI